MAGIELKVQCHTCISRRFCRRNIAGQLWVISPVINNLFLLLWPKHNNMSRRSECELDKQQIAWASADHAALLCRLTRCLWRYMVSILVFLSTLEAVQHVAVETLSASQSAARSQYGPSLHQANVSVLYRKPIAMTWPFGEISPLVKPNYSSKTLSPQDLCFQRQVSSLTFAYVAVSAASHAV